MRFRSFSAWPAVFGCFLVFVLRAPEPAWSQTAGLTCFQCPGATLPVRICPVNETIQIGSGCIGFNNCQTPETDQHGVEIIATGPDTFQARLVVEARARWNSDPDAGPNSTLDLFWRSGATAADPTTSLCEHLSSDRAYTILFFSGLTCDGAPYAFGTYSLRAVVCNSPSCRRVSDENGMVFGVTKQMLNCPEPPKQDCDDCRACPLSGVPADGRGPRLGGPEFGAGGGAYLSYAAGGAGSHPQYPGTAAWNVALGRNWSHSYAMRLFEDPDESRMWLIEKTATFREFQDPNGAGVYETVSPSTEKRTLTWLGPGLGWILTELDGAVHEFNASGLWLSTVDRHNNATVATYAGSQLTSVSFPDGRREDFAYHPDGKLASITEVGVDGVTTRAFSYTWSGLDLVRADRPDGTALIFQYGDPNHPGYLSRLELEGSGGLSTRVLRAFAYDPGSGKVVQSWRGDASPAGPDAVDLWSLAYDDPAEPTMTTVTPPVGDPITYQLGRDTVSTNVKVLQVSGDCPTCLAPNSQLSYSDPQNPMLPTLIVDGRGTATALSYDAFGQVTSRTEAIGQTEERTTTWSYDPSYPALVTSTEQPSVAGGASTRTTGWLLDASGNALERTITGVEAGSAFSYTTTTTYNAVGQPLTIDPPGHGTADQTSFTYDPARGDLLPLTREDPLPPSGTMTTSFGYDAFNRRALITDPNGVETTIAYDPLDRVTEVRAKGASPPADDLVTAHSYTVFGDLFRTTLPRGNVIEHGYDAAGRLLSVERKPDASTHGERVLYTLDEAGNRTLEELQRWDAGAAAWVTHASTAYEYSTRCQVDRIVQAPGSPEQAVTEQEYDCNGNLSAQWDPNHDSATDPPTTSYT